MVSVSEVQYGNFISWRRKKQKKRQENWHASRRGKSNNMAKVTNSTVVSGSNAKYIPTRM